MANDQHIHTIRIDFNEALYVERQEELAAAQEWRENGRRVLTITSPPANGKTWFLTRFQHVLREGGQPTFKIDVGHFLTAGPMGGREINPDEMQAWSQRFVEKLREQCDSVPAMNEAAETAAVLSVLSNHVGDHCWPGQPIYLFVDGGDEPSVAAWKVIEKQILEPILAHQTWRVIIALRQFQRLHSYLLRREEDRFVLSPLPSAQREKFHPGHDQLRKLINQSSMLTPPFEDIVTILPGYEWTHLGLNHFLFLEARHQYTNHQRVLVGNGLLERGITALTPLINTDEILVWLRVISQMSPEWRIEELMETLSESRTIAWQIIQKLQEHLLITNTDNRYRITDGVREFIHAAQALV